MFVKPSRHFDPPTPLNTAVLFLVFNRPDVTAQVFEAIRKAKPPRLYVAADGPRSSRPGEVKRCAEVRRIATAVDWPCEVKTLFRDENMGCKAGVSSGISWFFGNEEEGIILEDDCLPSLSFFWFCEELLEKYKDDERVFIISGYNKRQSWNPAMYDYFFSNFGGIWGWASWRRAWQKYDMEMSNLDEFIKADYFTKLLGPKLGKIREKQILNSPKTTWDYAWGFSRHVNSGLACVPSRNLIENIGFGEGATHTCSGPDNICRHEIIFPLRDNIFIVADRKYDELFFSQKSLTSRIYNKVMSFMRQ